MGENHWLFTTLNFEHRMTLTRGSKFRAHIYTSNLYLSFQSDLIRLLHFINIIMLLFFSAAAVFAFILFLKLSVVFHRDARKRTFLWQFIRYFCHWWAQSTSHDCHSFFFKRYFCPCFFCWQSPKKKIFKIFSHLICVNDLKSKPPVMTIRVGILMSRKSFWFCFVAFSPSLFLIRIALTMSVFVIFYRFVSW